MIQAGIEEIPQQIKGQAARGPVLGSNDYFQSFLVLCVGLDISSQRQGIIRTPFVSDL